MSKAHSLLFYQTIIAMLLMVSAIGCRSVDRVAEGTPEGISGNLPLTIEGFELFESEGILVYARDEASARNIATRAEQAESLLRETTGQDPSRLVYFAIDSFHPDRQALHSRAFQNSSQQWNMKNRAISFSGSQGVRKDSEMGNKMEDSLPRILPGLLETPEPHPESFKKYGVAMATSDGVKSGINELIDFGIESAQLNTLQRILAAPIIVIVRKVLIDVLARVEDALIVGTHLRGRAGWDEDKIQAVMTEILDLESFGEQFRSSNQSPPPSP
ncbi:MAG: hypothetical protein CBC13_01800 [Planctomycetia bacterium TMED53]|nr:MAG: hypothetical protein CBC13_01800 [Planctomycetia bacterium TMED53]